MMIILFMLPLFAFSQSEEPEIEPAEEVSEEDELGFLSFGFLRTEAEKGAVRVGAKYGKSLKDKDKDILAGDWAATISPFLDFQAGEDDSFERVVAKMEGLILTPNSYTLGASGNEIHYYLPFAIGLEADRNFENYAGILEAGVAPFLHQARWGEVLEPTFALQAGYKFASPTNEVEGIMDGNLDESDEREDDFILRAKASLELDYTLLAIGEEDRTFLTLGQSGFLQAKVIGSIDLYYDIQNSDFHDREVLGVDFALKEGVIEENIPLIGEYLEGLSKNIDALNLSFENGSGAPNFNRGEQWSASLKASF